MVLVGYQLLIIMAFDPISGLFIPSLYILLTGKMELIYKRIFKDIDAIMEKQWKPKSVIVDFEKGLINSIR